jgi:uncharacterized lipoprotein YajG
MMVAALALAGCSGKGATSQAAQQQASDITNAQVAASGGLPGANVSIKGYDAKGCKEKAKAVELIAASKLDDKAKFIKLLTDGMKDETCRGFASGLPVKVDHTEGNLACILPGDDPQNKQCFWIEATSL